MESTEPQPTTTTTTTSTSNGFQLTINVTFLKSISSFLYIFKLVIGLICWALAASYSYSFHLSPYGFIGGVTVTAWVTTILMYCILVFSVNHSICPTLPWPPVELVFNGVWSIFYFVASCMIAVNSCCHPGYPAAQASAVFAFFVTAAYVVNTLLAFRGWRGRLPWQ